MTPMRWLNRHMGVLVLVGVMLTLGGLTYTATHDADVKAALHKRVVLQEGGYVASVSLAKGADKPVVSTPEGRTLLDVSGWESVLRIDGEGRPLYREEYNVASDGQVAYLTWSSQDYLVEERIEATADGVRIAWSVLLDERHAGKAVELEVGQFAYYMRNVTYDDGRIAYRLDAVDPRFGSTLPPADGRDYAVEVVLDRVPEQLWFGETPRGIDGFHATYQLRPPAGELVRVFEQRLSYVRADEPGPPTGPLFFRGEAFEAPDGQRVAIVAGDLETSIALHKGTDKPLLRAADGRILLDVSAWETTLRVNGTTRALYEHEFRVDADEKRAVVTWLDPDYTLEQSITATSGGLDISWTWLRQPHAGDQHVQLDIAQFAAYMENVTSDGRNVTYSLAATDGGAPYAFRVGFDRTPARLRLGETPNGTDALRATFVLEDAPRGERVVLANESILVRRGAPDAVGPAPPVHQASPVWDDALDAYLLHAGDYHASIRMGRGADKPLLQSPDGRVLQEVSGWESHLRVNGREMSLYRHDVRADVLDGRPCLLWSDAAYALRQCVNVSSEGMRIDWSWRRAPGAANQSVELTVAHFAYLLTQAGINGTNVDYRLDALDPRVGASEEPPYYVHMRLSHPPQAAPFSADAFRLRYALEDPPEAEWVPFFWERLWYDRGAPP